MLIKYEIVYELGVCCDEGQIRNRTVYCMYCYRMVSSCDTLS